MDHFKNILVPVDLTVNTEVAVKKAVQLADHSSNIHLLYIRHYSGFGLSYTYKQLMQSDKLDGQHISEKLDQWKVFIERSIPGISVCMWITMNESIQAAIQEKAKELNADLVIIGKTIYHTWFPFLNTVIPSQIAWHASVPVLTARPGALESTISTAVFLISSNSPESKIDFLSALCNRFNLKIYIASYIDDESLSNSYSSLFLQMYKRIRSFSQCPVEYIALRGRDKTKAVLDFTKKVNADILLVQSESQTRQGSLKQISGTLPPTSKMHILSI